MVDIRGIRTYCFPGLGLKWYQDGPSHGSCCWAQKKLSLSKCISLDPDPKVIGPPSPISIKRSNPPPTEAPVHGRYVSKGERALPGTGSPSTNALDPSNADPSASTSAVSCMGSLVDSDLPSVVLSPLRLQTESRGHLGQIEQRLSIQSNGQKVMVFIWNVWSKNHKKAHILNNHNAAEKNVRWSKLGWHVLTCGYDCTSRLVDIEKGIETQVFKEDQVINVVKSHPENFNLFLSGGAKGQLRLRDAELAEQHISKYANLVQSLIWSFPEMASDSSLPVMSPLAISAKMR